ncbi:MAG: BON domain-containing protein [Gammaproteobacteria bacterium]|nr:BON domain-containing protein [Rhodocyclaceae bacterium]MBU3910541.1 BON domain-containing protein [Gammaproteobacteria bacterium]MBU3989079.1 BON domain-containing protein [Gammaproteobacteria bacterium]MBU4005022.1 BON domain-containing protein [Gammaproteobacteria bacterium]MBU4020615.1 BON domain-containing protein [Gammaproteobacteria bacterium]
MKLLMQARSLLLLAVLVPFLAGCFGVAAVGVGAGALIFADRRQAETIGTDEGIEIRAVNRISEKFGDRAHVNVTSYNRTVLLTGEVPDAAAKAEIEKIVATVANVKAISNELRIGTVSTLSNRSNDTFITSKVKARFIDADQFSANHIKVVTENSVVYLMGLATQREANAAVEIARTTAGVHKVVRVFELIDDAYARSLDPKPSKPAAQ